MDQLNLFGNEKQRRPATSYPKHEWLHPTKTWEQHWRDTHGVGWLGDTWIKPTGCTLVTQCGKENCLHEAEKTQ